MTGPVVRIGPNEVHFSSPSAFLHIYSQTSKATKDPFHYHCFDQDLSTFCTCDPVAAKQRRDIMNPFFSRRNILSLQHLIVDKVCLFTHQLRKIHLQNSENVVDLVHAARSFSMDIITEFCFARTLNVLRVPGFEHELILSTEGALRIFWFFKYFPIVKHLMANMPEWMIPPGSRSLLMLKHFLHKQVNDFVADPEAMATGVGHEVIYNRLLGVGDSKSDEKSASRPVVSKRSLYDESELLVFAGSDTVGNTITVGMVHILSTPGVLQNLMAELKTIWPENPWGGMPSVEADYVDGCGNLPFGWEALEKLPYLSGVIRESLRLSHGAVSPLHRIAPAQGITIDGWKFPAGVSINYTPSSPLEQLSNNHPD